MFEHLIFIAGGWLTGGRTVMFNRRLPLAGWLTGASTIRFDRRLPLAGWLLEPAPSGSTADSLLQADYWSHRRQVRPPTTPWRLTHSRQVRQPPPPQWRTV